MVLYVAVDRQRQLAKGVHLRMYLLTWIAGACTQHFPLQRLQSASTSEKETRNAIDEVCRKTKLPAVGGVENDCLT